LDACSADAATGGPNVKWGGTDFICGDRAPLAPPLAMALRRWFRPIILPCLGVAGYLAVDLA